MVLFSLGALTNISADIRVVKIMFMFFKLPLLLLPVTLLLLLLVLLLLLHVFPGVLHRCFLFYRHLALHVILPLHLLLYFSA